MTNEKGMHEKYGGYLDFSGKQGRKWLDGFRSDLRAIIEVLEDWHEAAYRVETDAQDYNYSPAMGFSVPSWFLTLTSIVALWCDTELHIDPSALTEFKRRMRDFRGNKRAMPNGKVELHRVPMTDEEIEACFWTAKETWERVFHATLARATEAEQKAVEAQYHSPNEARDKWIYDEAMKGTAWSKIAEKLKKKPKGWTRIDADGCRRAATRYAEKHHLPLPPTRQRGRPKRTAKNKTGI